MKFYTLAKEPPFHNLVVEAWSKESAYGASADAKTAGNLPASANDWWSMDSIYPNRVDNVELCGQNLRSEARPSVLSRKKGRP